MTNPSDPRGPEYPNGFGGGNENPYAHQADPYGGRQFGYGPQQQHMMGSYQAAMKPDNYMLWTVLSLLFAFLCCVFTVPISGVGIYFSTQVDKKWQMGLIDEAHDASRKARALAIAGIAVPIVFILLFVLFEVVSALTSGY